jgi:hypothetical protein
MANFPNDVPTLTNPSSGSSPVTLSHAQQHADANDNIEALCTKLGTGAATPAANRLLTGTGAGTSDWSKVTPAGTIVGTTDSQTLTNKVLTSPTINTATIVNPTLQTDTISEYTPAAGVTVDGLLIKDGKISGTAITNDTITDDQLDYPRWWQEIGRTTLGGAADTITVSSLPVRKYLRLQISLLNTGGAITTSLRFNNDSANNYAFQYMANNSGANVTSGSGIFNLSNIANPYYATVDIMNIATQIKFALVQGMDGSTNAATAPNYVNFWAKWVNATDAITRVDIVNGGAGDFATGSQIVVLGHD